MALNPSPALALRDLDGLLPNADQPGKGVGPAFVALLNKTDEILAAADGVPAEDILASTTVSEGASLIGVQDAAALLDGATVEAALADISKGNGLTALAPVRRVRAVTAANMASFTGVSTTLDGLTLVAGDRVLVRRQTVAAQNGIYVVGTVGGGTADWTRATDMPAAAVVPNGTLIVVDAGTLGANTVHKLTNAGAITIATTGLTFECFKLSASGLIAKVVVAAKAGNDFEVVGSIVDDAGVLDATASRPVVIETLAVTDGQGDLAAGTPAVGTIVKATNPAAGWNTLWITAAAGLFNFKVTDTAAEVVILRISGAGLKTLVQVVGPA